MNRKISWLVVLFAISLAGCSNLLGGGKLVPDNANTLDADDEQTCSNTYSDNLSLTLCREKYYSNNLHNGLDKAFNGLEKPTYDSLLLGTAILSSGAATADVHVSVLKGLAWGTASLIGSKDFIQPEVKRDLLKESYGKTFCLKNSSDLASRAVDNYLYFYDNEYQSFIDLHKDLRTELQYNIGSPDLVGYKSREDAQIKGFDLLEDLQEIKNDVESKLDAFREVDNRLQDSRGKLIAELRVNWANTFGTVKTIEVETPDKDKELILVEDAELVSQRLLDPSEIQSLIARSSQVAFKNAKRNIRYNSSEMMHAIDTVNECTKKINGSSQSN